MIPNLRDPRRTHSDNVYMNAKYVNDSRTAANVISFQSDRNEYLVSAASDYYLIVESFELPNQALPIFNFDNTPVGGVSPYAVTIELGGVLYITPLEFEDRGDLVNPSNTNSGKIYFVDQFLVMVNNALIDSATAAGVGAPFMEYDENNEKFSITRPGANPTGTIYFTNDLYRLFFGLDAKFNGYGTSDHTDWELQLDTIINLKLVQDCKSLFNWSDVQSVFLFSNTLPVLEENFTNRIGNGQDEKFKIINDFKPIKVAESCIDRSPWRYESDFPRLIDLRSDVKLYSVDFTFEVLDNNGNLTRIAIPPGETVTVKFRFAKKALFNNEYNLTDLDERVKQYNIHSYHHKH